MENKVPDELLNLFLNNGQEVDGQLPNPPDVELPDDVSCNSPSKPDLPQRLQDLLKLMTSCNSPSKSNLPQPTIDNILIINVFN